MDAQQTIRDCSNVLQTDLSRTIIEKSYFQLFFNQHVKRGIFVIMLLTLIKIYAKYMPSTFSFFYLSLYSSLPHYCHASLNLHILLLNQKRFMEIYGMSWIISSLHNNQLINGATKFVPIRVFIVNSSTALVYLETDYTGCDIQNKVSLSSKLFDIQSCYYLFAFK